MNRLLTAFVGLGLVSFQAQAMVVETVTGETFAGYANTFIGTNSVLATNLGSTGSDNWSFDEGVNGARVTDTSAATSTLGASMSTGNYIDLGFDASIFNGAGDDLKLFFVGGNGHDFDVTIGNVTVPYSLAAGTSATGFFDPAFPTDPIIALAINLDSFSGLTGDSFSEIRLTIGDGYTADSAVPSFVGTYNLAPATVVPVPAAVWLFGSGLIGLVGVARRRK